MKFTRFLLLSLLSIFPIINAYANKLPIQHGVNYRNNININDYWISEKLDGMRGYWNGKNLLTRQGNPIYLPKGFSDNWPNVPLDGELWSARGKFQEIISCTRKKTPSPKCWQHIKFMVFDLPESTLHFSQRIQQINQYLAQSSSQTIAMITQFTLTNNKQLFTKLDEVVALGGEGLMLHHKKAYYHSGRNAHLLKLKPYQDAEATVLKHIKGKGKYKTMLGALLVENAQGIQFKIGTGFSDNERQHPPKIGSKITYKYIGKTKRGVPRFASFLRIKQ